MSRSWKFPNLFYLVCLVIFLLGCLLHFQRGYYYTGLNSTHAQGADDAYITYRYGWNLAHYGTLSWNESGYRRTEGFTNPLWVYLSSLWSLLGRKEWVYPLTTATSVGLVLILLEYFIYIVYKVHQDSVSSIIGLVLFAATPVIWIFSTSGLESGVFGMSAALLAYLVIFSGFTLPRGWIILLLCLLVGLLRSDGFVYLSIILVGALIAGSQNWKVIALGLIISTAVLITWRWVEFGTWLPNTYFAKVNFQLQDRLRVGLVFLFYGLRNSGALVLMILGLAGLVYLPARLRLAGAWIFAAWIAYYLYIGGDTFVERHLVGMFILAAATSSILWQKSKRHAQVWMALIVVIGIFLAEFGGMGRSGYLRPKLNDPLVMLGKEMSQERERYGVVLTSAAGKIPFYAGGDFIDTLGLNDPYLATLQRPRFIPGHSAGNDQAALEIAKTHPSGIVSVFSYLDPTVISSADAVALWVNNREPQEAVQYGATEAQWQAALASGDFYLWSIILQPIHIPEEIP